MSKAIQIGLWLSASTSVRWEENRRVVKQEGNSSTFGAHLCNEVLEKFREKCCHPRLYAGPPKASSQPFDALKWVKLRMIPNRPFAPTLRNVPHIEHATEAHLHLIKLGEAKSWSHEELDKGKSIQEVASKFRVASGTVFGWKKDKEKICQRAISNESADSTATR
ncbi:hypothetical protein BJ742DRAFT_869474 [Cladochytrium replicatum]|nr:hypothetical protein BJ742DRAFT_869474 [Cladochytrium replicatum]